MVMSIIPTGKSPHSGDPADEDGVNWRNEECLEYLKDLDSRPDVELTDWEAGFVGGFADRDVYNFSLKQRKVIKNLVQKYGE